jgi:DNA repair protein REV1
MGGRGQGHMRLTAEEPEMDPTSEHHKGSFRNYMIVKNRHLHQQYEEHVSFLKASGSCSDLFKGISIHVNGYTNPTHQVRR